MTLEVVREQGIKNDSWFSQPGTLIKCGGMRDKLNYKRQTHQQIAVKIIFTAVRT